MLVAFVVRVDQALSLPTPQCATSSSTQGSRAALRRKAACSFVESRSTSASLSGPDRSGMARRPDGDDLRARQDDQRRADDCRRCCSTCWVAGRHPGMALLAPVLAAAADDAAQRSAHDRAPSCGHSCSPSTRSCSRWSAHMGAPGFVLLTVRLATAVRLQGLALVAVPGTAIVLAVVFELHCRAPQRSAPVLLGEAEAVLAHGRLIAAAPSSSPAAAQAYEEVARAEYSVTEAWRMTKLHLADLALVCGFAPAECIDLADAEGVRGRHAHSPNERHCGCDRRDSVAARAGRRVRIPVHVGRGRRALFYVMPVLLSHWHSGSRRGCHDRC